MSQTISLASLPGRLISLILSVCIMFSATHVSAISTLTIPGYGENMKSNQQKTSDSASMYKIDIHHHDHIDKLTLKSMLKRVNKYSHDNDARSLNRNRRGVARKTSKRQRSNELWQSFLGQVIA